MGSHRFGALPKIGQTLRYVAHRHGAWLALAVFSAAALKCRARDRWVMQTDWTIYMASHIICPTPRRAPG